MWGGISFSQNHVTRDMIGYETTSDKIYDLYSLYAAAPYEDTATNIQGTDDSILLSSSSFQRNTFHFTEFYRLYDTGDKVGDEKIRKKIKTKYCFTAYFSDDSSPNI
eukprot:GHVR01124445.1.p1 GENE.GHVR01124445.1~~GHVR01124445.1.p1  ORF type:complete len:107 (-),score=3.30 GHVR01124445.1:690-1010(-)